MNGKPRLSNLALLLTLTSGIMLLGMLFYPHGYDQSAFAVGGEMILKKGMIPYRDFLDTKPPIIFYIYAISALLFGHHEWSIRVLDVIVQAAATIYFYRILARYLSRDTAILAAAISLILYCSIGFWMTAQAEGFAILPSLLTLDCTLRFRERPDKALQYGAIVGIATVLLFFLKFTLVLGPAAAFVFVVLSDTSFRDKLRFVLGLVIAKLVVGGAYVGYLAATGALSYFLEGIAWVSKYAALDPLFGATTIATKYFTLFPEILSNTFSLTLMIVGAWSVIGYLRSRSLRQTDGSSSLLALSLLTGAFHLFGVLYERKMFPYHYSRAFFAFAPFIAIALVEVLSIASNIWKQIQMHTAGKRVVGSLLFVCGACALLFFSPAVRVMSQTVDWTVLQLRGGDIGREIHHRITDYAADEQQQVGHWLQTHMSPSDHMFFWGNDVSVYYYANTLPTTICLTATPLRTTWTPKHWTDRMMSQLNAAPPNYFVTEFGDAKEYITGSTLDSYQALQAQPALSTFLTSSYTIDTTIGHYMVFRRKQCE